MGTSRVGSTKIFTARQLAGGDDVVAHDGATDVSGAGAANPLGASPSEGDFQRASEAFIASLEAGLRETQSPGAATEATDSAAAAEALRAALEDALADGPPTGGAGESTETGVPTPEPGQPWQVAQAVEIPGAGPLAPANVAPVVDNFSKSLQAGEKVTFSASDFTSNFTDVEADNLVNVKITWLPAHGTLELSGSPVSAGQEVVAANLENLTFTAGPDFRGVVEFGWTAFDGTTFAASSARVTFSASDFTDKLTDVEADDVVKIKIISLPPHGTLEFNDSPVSVGQEIVAADLENLTFTAGPDYRGEVAFGWSAFDGTTFRAGPPPPRGEAPPGEVAGPPPPPRGEAPPEEVAGPRVPPGDEVPTGEVAVPPLPPGGEALAEEVAVLAAPGGEALAEEVAVLAAPGGEALTE